MGTQVDFLPWNRSLPFNPKRLPKQSCPISFPFSTHKNKTENPEFFCGGGVFSIREATENQKREREEEK